jgi:ketosteroid isomerase-like protein
MKRIALAVGLMLLFAAFPAQAQTVTAVQKAVIEKTLTDATKEIVASINQLSVAALEKYQSAEFQERVTNGDIQATGKAASLKVSADNISQRISQKWEIDSIIVHILSPDLAYVVTVMGGYITYKNGRHGGYGDITTRIWRKESGGWKYVHQHESTQK